MQVHVALFPDLCLSPLDKGDITMQRGVLRVVCSVCVCVCVCVGTSTRELVDSEIKLKHKEKVCYKLHPIVDCSTMSVSVLC